MRITVPTDLSEITLGQLQALTKLGICPVVGFI